MNPKISVIVPIYNAELYLEECIHSVLNQTLRDIELLLIDDGSTDGSFRICEEYSKKDNRVQVFRNKNVGQGLERNFGVRKSAGEYIAFLDSDDQYKEDALERLYQKAMETNADMVSGGYADVCNHEIIKEHLLGNRILDSTEKIKKVMSDLISYEKKEGYDGCIAVWDSIFKKQLLIDNNIQFLSERDIYSEDLLYKLMVMSCSRKITFCNDITYLYRVNDTSFTNRISESVLNRITNLYDEIILRFEEFLQEFNLKERLVNRTFFTLRFNIKKVSKSRDVKKFYKMIFENKKLMGIVVTYKPNNLKNFVIYYLIKWKMLGMFYMFF